MSLSSPDLRHFVQFYESADFLLDSVAGFIAAGLRVGEGAVIIARPEYRSSLRTRLTNLGQDLPRLKKNDQYIEVDAAETLAKLTDEDWPEEELFNSVIQPLVFRAARDGNKVRAFGEMVSLLWEQARLPAAIRLEQLWEGMTKGGILSLFCAYPVANVHGKVLDAALIEICRNHSHVRAGESYARLERDEDRTREVILLQQKARALEAELAKRRELEIALFRREQQLSDLFNNGLECLHQVAADGRILWANQAEMNLLGYQADEYIGHEIKDFHVDPDVAADMIERLLRAETLHNYPARLRCKDGSVRCVLIHSNALWQDGQLKQTRCFTREVTAQMYAEAAKDRALLRPKQTPRG